jgi:hypothetical protein
MLIEDLGDIIATRTLDYIGQGKQRLVVDIAIGKPRQFSDSEDYYVPYRIKGVGVEKLGYAAGVDAVQALQLVMRGIGADLLSISRKLPGQLRWIGNEPGEYGFPS